MVEVKSDNRRIAKNTVYMYIRMFVTMLIGLYTSRVILSSLGFEDYGLYNVVGGIIAMFGFINNAMTNTTSRYITYYLGKNNVGRLQEVFSTSLYIHFIIAFLIVVLGETIGLWYLHNKLVVSDGRMTAAIWLYQFTIITAIANIISVPFNASIIAHEKMSAYAVIAIIDAVLKLAIAISIKYAPFDKLIYYGLMILMVQLLDNIIYWIYSYKNFPGIRIKRVFDKGLFKEMFGFTGWNLFGNFSYIFYTQGLNLILNSFFGTAVNAARGIAVQVEGIVRQFASNVQTAINPQIIKSYAQGENERFFSLIFASSRYCFYLLFLLTLPIILEARFLLALWLVDFPEHTISFMRITLISVTLEALVSPLFMANLASGKVKLYQTCIAIIDFTFIPLTFLAIKLTLIPEAVFICTLVLRMIEIIARIFIVHKQVGLPRRKYVTNVLFNVFVVAVIASIIPCLVYMNMQDTIARFFVVGAISVCSTLLVVYFIGINQQERNLAKAFILRKINRNSN